MIRSLLAPLAVLLVAVTIARAQAVYTQAPGLPSMNPTYLPSPAYPNGKAAYTGPVALPNSLFLGPAAPTAGGIAIDQTTKRVFCTDGFTITTDYHNLYAPFVPPGPLPGPMPAPLLLGSTPLSGLGADPAGGRLWATDGTSYAALTLGAPFTVIGAALPLPFALAPGAMLTGIDYEGSTGTLWGCDVLGNIYQWFPFGAAIGPQPVASVATPFPVVGIAVNETNGPGALGPPFCSTQVLGFHIVVADLGQIHDALNPTNPTIGCAPGNGLAYSSDQQYLPGVGAPPILVGTPGWNKPQNNTLVGLNALRLVGAQPLTTTLFLYDFCPIPGGLFIWLSGETLWINPFSFTFNFATFVTDGSGQINFPIDLTPSLTGFTYTGQFALFSPTSPLSYAFSDAMCFTIGLP